MAEKLETMLSGGHHNSLGRTAEVVDVVLAETDRLPELFDCYASEDELVRLRVSSAMRRVEAARHDLLVPYLDRFLDEIGALDQPSAQWTLAILFEALEPDMDTHQKQRAKQLMQRNLAENPDWIVLNNTMEALFRWSEDDTGLREWLVPHLERLTGDRRKSVASRATKLLRRL